VAVQRARLHRLGAQLADSLGNRVAAFTVLPREKFRKEPNYGPRILGRKEPNYTPGMIGFGFVRSLR
jgi:hypothetical protein